MQDANKRKMLADRVLNECKTAMELNIDHVPKFFAESVAAVQALTVTKGLKLLANFIDRDSDENTREREEVQARGGEPREPPAETASGPP